MARTSSDPKRRRGMKHLRVGRSHWDSQQLEVDEVDENKTVWDIYNKYSRTVDEERMRDWNDTLSTLLVFAALYSAVLTAFIIESLTLIQEDTSESARDILLHISNQIANHFSPSFNSTSNSFVAPQWALNVNYCFFISLCFSLVTALAAVLALQWVGSYDQGLNPSSVERCALQRQFRREGATYWKLQPIIASLPTLIFISLLLFFVGLAEWMWNVDHSVGIIVIVTTAIGTIFYFATTLISIYSTGAPFRTPVSRYLPQLIGGTLSLVPRFFKYVRHVYPTRSQANFLSSFQRSMKHFASRRFWSWSSFRALLQNIFHLFSPLATVQSFKSRETDAVNRIMDIDLSSLFWISRIISIEASQRQNFITVLRAILSQGKRSKNQIDSYLWTQIFKVLRSQHSELMVWQDYSKKELDDAVVTMHGLSSVLMGWWEKGEFQSLIRDLYQNYADPDGMAQILLRWQTLESQTMQRIEQKELTEWEKISIGHSSVSDGPVSLEDSDMVIEHEGIFSEDQIRHLNETILASYDYVLNNLQSSPPEFLVVMLQNINAVYLEISDVEVDQRKSILPASHMLQLISEKLSMGLSSITKANTVPLQILEMLQELVTANLTAHLAETRLPPITLEPYLYLMGRRYDEGDGKQVIDAYTAMIQQRIARISQMSTSSLSNDEEIPNMLFGTLQMAQSPLWTHVSESLATPILVSIAELGSSLWEKKNRDNSAHLMALALQFKWELNGKNWSKWWVETMLAFSKLIESKSYELGESLFIRHGSLLLSADLPGQDSLPDPEIRKLKKISHIGVRLFAMTVTKSVDLARSILIDGLEKSSDKFWTPSEAWTTLIDQCHDQFEKREIFVEEVFRALAIGSSLTLYDRIYRDKTVKFKSTPDLYQYVRSPVLPAFLRHSSGREIRTWRILNTVCSHESFSSEFIKINGLGWLHQFVAERPIRFKEAISFIYQSITKCHDYEDSKAWLVASHKCAESAVAAIRNDKIVARELWQSISNNTRLIIDHLERKTDGIPVSTSQGKVTQTNARDNLDGPTKKDDALVGREVTQKDPVIKNWTEEEKQEFRCLIDEFTQEIYGILGHVLEISFLWDMSLFPSSDIYLLRRLTISQPHMCLGLLRCADHNILSISSVAFNHFRAPVLERILRKGDLHEIMKILTSISHYPWFRDEFIRAKGPELVPQILRPVYLEEAIKVVNNQLPHTKDPSSILLWVTLARDCLKSVGRAISSISSSEHMKNQYNDMMDYAKGGLKALLEEIIESMNKWRIERMQQQTSTESASRRSESIMREDSNGDASQWSQADWDQISSLVGELIPSLQCGYILPSLSERDTRFPYDPDGFCLHTHSFATERIRARLTLLEQLGRFPLNAEDLYSRRQSLISDGDEREEEGNNEEEEEDSYDEEEEEDGIDDDVKEGDSDVDGKWW